MNDYGSYRYLPADGWYATYPQVTDTDQVRVFQRVALWRVAPHGTIVGLISSLDGDQEDIESQLLSAPRGQGVHYIHMDDMTEQEREQIRHRRFS